jgi:hypothetical protein
MSASAGTPSAPSLKVAGSGRASSLEPSPASTYGGSVSSDAGDDVPQTPNDGTYPIAQYPIAFSPLLHVSSIWFSFSGLTLLHMYQVASLLGHMPGGHLLVTLRFLFQVLESLLGIERVYIAC